MLDVLPSLPMLAQSAVGDPRLGWAPIVLLILIGVGFAVGVTILSTIVGPGRTGPAKETTYESGMMPVGDTRQRFNVRFYIVAMIFLVFDVEIVFFYPWASIFPHVAQTRAFVASGPYADLVPTYSNPSTLLLVEMFVFIAILLLAYFYAWGKGVFRWD